MRCYIKANHRLPSASGILHPPRKHRTHYTASQSTIVKTREARKDQTRGCICMAPGPPPRTLSRNKAQAAFVSRPYGKKEGQGFAPWATHSTTHFPLRRQQDILSYIIDVIIWAFFLPLVDRPFIQTTFYTFFILDNLPPHPFQLVHTTHPSTPNTLGVTSNLTHQSYQLAADSRDSCYTQREGPFLIRHVRQ